MGVRLLNEVRPANVILFPARAWQPTADAETPGPAQLYHLTVLAFLLHTPAGEPQLCASCGQQWPCDHVCLAYRLREGF
jgi:hypothetical protein